MVLGPLLCANSLSKLTFLYDMFTLVTLSIWTDRPEQTCRRQSADNKFLTDAFYIFSSKECNLMMIWWSGILCPFQHYLCHTVTKRRLIMPRKALWRGVQSWTEPKDLKTLYLMACITAFNRYIFCHFCTKTYLVNTHWNCLSEYSHGMFWCKSSGVVP